MSGALTFDFRTSGPGAHIPTPKVPALPTLIRPLPDKPLQADSLDALARHVHQLRGERVLRIGKVEFASYGGSDTFACFPLFAIDPDSQGEDWLGHAIVQAEQPDRLQDALRRAEQRKAA